jgi:hypothetical protein
VFVKELGKEGMWLSPWAFHEYEKMTNKAIYLQEYEIDGSATQGSLVYELHEEAALEESFPIPEHWTRYMSLDPHPAVPHAFLWVAIDPWGDAWAYRELWPSKVAYRFENGVLLGQPGICPDEDNRYRIKQYVETVKFLESRDNPENQDVNGKPFDESVRLRVIDYAARAFGKGTVDDDPTDNYQVRYEKTMADLGLRPSYFEDAKKNRGVGEENVNEWLRPRDIDDGQDGWRKKSKLRIFRDRCPELIYQLKNNRRAQLSSEQAQKQDPTGIPVQVRKHMTDNLLYICAANPVYVPVRHESDTSEPIHPGLSY